MGFDWVYVNPFHETGGSGSLYAISDPFRLDPRFRDERAGDDDDQIRAFAEEAASHGLKVMTDLVINHTANDARLARSGPDVYDRDETGGIRAPSRSIPTTRRSSRSGATSPSSTTASPPRRTSCSRYWDGYVARLQALGIRGFRCDAAYKVPPEVWRHLIGRAKARDRGCLFAAETLGCTFDETQATAGAGFDYLFNSFAWWDLRAPWALENYEALRTVAPSIAFPENHDMAAHRARTPGTTRTQVARALKARYALAAFFSTGVLMPIGYEWGYRRAAPRGRDHARAPREDRHRHLGLRRRHQPAADRAAGRERRGRAMVPLGAGRAVPRAAALRRRPPGGGAQATLVLANLTHGAGRRSTPPRSSPAPAAISALPRSARPAPRRSSFRPGEP